jgi:PEP-CTERM motif
MILSRNYVQQGNSFVLPKSFAIAALAAIGLSQASAATAALVIDQEQTTFAQGNLLDYGPGFSNLPLGQSITAGMSGRLGAFDIAANRFIDFGTGAPATLTLEIRAGNGLAGTVLGSTTQTLGCNPAVDFGAFGPCGVRFTLTSLGINVVAGQQYTLLLTAGSGDGNIFEFGWLSTSNSFGPPANPYAGGQKFAALFANAGVEDMTFRSLIETSVGGVPEPSSWAMLITGFGLIGATMRHRRRAVA